jgi:tetratricopeptide (TPR) repeat protein
VFDVVNARPDRVNPFWLLGLAALFAVPAFAQTRPVRIVSVPAAPVTLVRSDADLFAATLAGRYAQGVSDPALAAQAWSLAFARQPNDGDILARAIEANLQAGLTSKAVILARSAAASILTDDAALVLGVDALTHGHYRNVASILNARSFPPSKRIIADHVRAYALLGEGKSAQAVELTSQVTGIRAVDKSALVSRALILDAAGRREEAGLLFQSAVDANVTTHLATRAHADWLLNTGRIDDARALYNRLILAGGPDTRVFVAALDAIDTTPKPIDYRVLQSRAAIGLAALVQSLSAEGRIAPSASFLSLVSRADPRSDAIRFALGSRWIDEGKADLARSILSQLPSTSPDYLAARTELVWLEFDGDKARAVALARETYTTMPGSSAAKRLLADILAGNRQDQEAETLYTSLIDQGVRAGRTAAHMWPLYFGRGGARERQGKWESGLSDLRQAQAAAPNQPSVLNYLGYALADRGENVTEAISLLQTAVRLRPQSASILDSLGWAQFKAGRFEEAVSSLERAAGMDSTIPEISDHLGDAYWRTGRLEEAKLEWQRALRLPMEDSVREGLARKIRDGLPPLS